MSVVALDRLAAALHAEDEYDGEYLAPEPPAAEDAEALLKSISTALVPAVTADGEGGLRLRWKRNGREVRLRVHCDGLDSPGSYLYWEEGRNHAADREPDIEAVARWLEWVAGGRFPK